MNKSIVLSQMGEIRNDLFKRVSLRLSQVEGQLSFLNSDDHNGGKRIAEGHAQVVGLQLQEQVAQISKDLNRILGDITESKMTLIKS